MNRLFSSSSEIDNCLDTVIPQLKQKWGPKKRIGLPDRIVITGLTPLPFLNRNHHCYSMDNLPQPLLSNLPDRFVLVVYLSEFPFVSSCENLLVELLSFLKLSINQLQQPLQYREVWIDWVSERLKNKKKSQYKAIEDSYCKISIQ